MKEIPHLIFKCKIIISSVLSGIDHHRRITISKQAVGYSTLRKLFQRSKSEGWKRSDWSCPQRRWSHLYSAYGTWDEFLILNFHNGWITSSPILAIIPCKIVYGQKAFQKKQSLSKRRMDDWGDQATRSLDFKKRGPKKCDGKLAFETGGNSLFKWATWTSSFFNRTKQMSEWMIWWKHWEPCKILFEIIEAIKEVMACKIVNWTSTETLHVNRRVRDGSRWKETISNFWNLTS